MFSLATSVSIASTLLGSVVSYIVLSLGLSDMTLFRLSLALSIVSMAALFLFRSDPPRVESLSIKDVLPRRSSRSITRIAIAGSLGALGLGMVTPPPPL